MGQQVSIDDMRTVDWARVRAIYAEGLADGLAAFLTTPPVWKTWNANHFDFGRLVARCDGRVVGWCGLSRVADT